MDPTALMRILHVTRSLSIASGGTAEAVRTLCLGLNDRGESNEVLVLDPPSAASDSVKLSCTVHWLGRRTGGYGYSQGIVSWLRMHRERFDAIVVHGLWQYGGLAVWRAVRELSHSSKRIPYFVFPHGMLDPWFKRTYPLKHFKKWLYWPWGEYRILRDAAAVLFTCKEEMNLARESFPKLYSAREAVVGLGLRDMPRDNDKLREQFLTAHPTLRGTRILLFLGRLHPKKGLDLLIRAFGKIGAEHPALRLVIVGAVSGTDVGPDYLVGLKQLADQTCPPLAVSFCGMLAGQEKWAALCAAEAFVLTSHQENFGLAVVEALACAKPVLISDKVNIWREIETDGGGLVEPDTLEGSTQLLKRWLGLRATDRKGMNERARSCFESRFAVERVTEVLVDVIRKHVDGKQPVATI